MLPAHLGKTAGIRGFALIPVSQVGRGTPVPGAVSQGEVGRTGT